jgi:hypothetical protein
MTAMTATPRKPSMAGMYRIPRAGDITNYLREADFFAAELFTGLFAAFFGALIAVLVRSLVTLIGPVLIIVLSEFKFSTTLFCNSAK